MKIIILAAGPAKRLMPLTKSVPKCLIEVNGRPIIEHQLEALAANGLTDVTVVIGHHGNKVRSALGARVKYVENEDYYRTNSAYSLWLAKKQIKNGYLHLNGDLLFHKDIISKLLSSDVENAIMINKNYVLEGDMQKVRMEGKKIKEMSKDLLPEVAVAEAVGPAKFSASGANRIIMSLNQHVAAGKKNIWAYSIFSDLSNNMDFYGIEIGDLYWCEVDNYEDLERANKVWSDK